MKVYEKVCEECKKPFTAKKPHARFCPKSSCRFDNWNRKHPRLKNGHDASDASAVSA